MSFSVKQWLNKVGSGTVLDAPSEAQHTPLDATGMRDLEGRLSSYSELQKIFTVVSGPRPAASSVPPGTPIWDAGLKEPLWSDGTTWRDGGGVDVNVNPPGAPTSLAARSTASNEMSLSWTAPSGSVTSYMVGRSITSEGPYTTVGSSLTVARFTDTGLINGITYYYVVAAVGPGGLGPYSAEVTGVPLSDQAPYDITSEWNTPISPSPALHTNSTAMVARVVAGGGSPPSSNWLTSDVDQYTIPVYDIDSSQIPFVPVNLNGGYHTFDAGDTTSIGHGFPAGAQLLPIPNNIQLAEGSDSQMILVDRVAGIEWGIWQLAGGPGNWTASNAFRSHVTSPDTQGNKYSGWFKDKTAGRGGGSSYLAGLVRPAEIDAGVIPHAIAWGFNTPLGFGATGGGIPIPPAPKSDGQGTHIDDPAEGTLWQLDPTFNVDTELASSGNALVDAFAKVVAKCLQKYGMYLIDHAGSTKIYVEYRGTAHWDPVITRDAVKMIPLNRMRVIAPPGYTAPVAVTGLAVQPGNLQAVLTWTASADPTVYRYDVYRALADAGPYTLVGSTKGVTADSAPGSPRPATTFTDSGLTNGTTYYYLVRPSNVSVQGPASAHVSVVPILAAPSAPVISASPGSGAVTLSWPSILSAQSYAIKRATSSGGAYTTLQSGITGTTYVDNTVTNGTTYYYVATATNAVGTSGNSVEVASTPQARMNRGVFVKATQNSSQTALTGTVTQATQSGDTLVIGVSGNNVSVTFDSAVDSRGNVYTAGRVLSGGNQTGRTIVFQSLGANGGPGGTATVALQIGDTVTITSNTLRQAVMQGVALAGVNIADQTAAASGGATSSQTPDSGATAVTGGGTIAIGVLGLGSPLSVMTSPGSTGWTIVGSGVVQGNQKGLGMAYKISSAAGAEQFAPTIGAPDGWHAICETFR